MVFLGSVLVPARRAVGTVGFWVLGDFESWSGCLECGDFGMPRALRAVIWGFWGFWVRGPICIDIYNIYMYYI